MSSAYRNITSTKTWKVTNYEEEVGIQVNEKKAKLKKTKKCLSCPSLIERGLRCSACSEDIRRERAI